MVGLNVMISVIISAAVAVFYTLIGQMISVAYTDIAELVMIVLGTVSEIGLSKTCPSHANQGSSCSLSDGALGLRQSIPGLLPRSGATLFFTPTPDSDSGVK